MIEFAISGAPVPKKRPQFRILKLRNGTQTVSTYTSPETVAAERALLLQSQKYRPRKPLAGAIGVTTVFVMPSPQNFPADRSRDWPHVTPDDDNLRKLVLDALNGAFWYDDSQICAGESFKVYGSKPRTHIRIWQLGRDDLSRVLAMIGEPMPQLQIFGGE